MNSIDIFSVLATIKAVERIHSTLDLGTLPSRLIQAIGFAPSETSTN